MLSEETFEKLDGFAGIEPYDDNNSLLTATISGNESLTNAFFTSAY